MIQKRKTLKSNQTERTTVIQFRAHMCVKALSPSSRCALKVFNDLMQTVCLEITYCEHRVNGTSMTIYTPKVSCCFSLEERSSSIVCSTRYCDKFGLLLF